MRSSIASVSLTLNVEPGTCEPLLVYKLCEYAGRGQLKLSSGKPVLPGRKQVFRISDNDRDLCDIIARADEDVAGRPLLVTVMHNGRRLPAGCVDLESARQYAQEQILRLPDHVRTIAPARPPYPVEVIRALSLYQKALEAQFAGA